MLASGKLFGVDDGAGRERRFNVNMGVHACGDDFGVKGGLDLRQTAFNPFGFFDDLIRDQQPVGFSGRMAHHGKRQVALPVVANPRMEARRAANGIPAIGGQRSGVQATGASSRISRSAPVFRCCSG